MKRVFVIVLLCYYSFGQIFLPEGSFSYLEQIPDLYNEFVQVNNDTDISEFLEEEFFDFDRLVGEEDDDPLEKEAKQVPFHTLPFTAFTYYTACKTIVEQTLPEDKKVFSSFYLLTDYTTEPSPIFHPPKALFT